MAIYSLFVPNGWRRAALVVTPMALMPVAVALILSLRHPELETVAGRAANVEQASDNSLMLLVGAIVSVVEAHWLGGCRTEGAEACSFGPYQPRERIGAGDG
jgi:eukaryotic-like serine/threonine-protein kinase